MVATMSISKNRSFNNVSMDARMTTLQLLEHNLELKDRVYRTASMGVAGASTTYEYFVV